MDEDRLILLLQSLFVHELDLDHVRSKYIHIYDKDSRNLKTTLFKALNFNNQVFDHADNTFKSCCSSSQSSISTMSV